jgi:flagellar protein FlaJ
MAVDHDYPTEDQPGYQQRDREDLQRTLYVSVAELFYPLYEYLFANQDRFIREFDRTLRGANMNTTSQLYLSAVTGLGMVVGLLTGLAVMTTTYMGMQAGLVSPPTFSVGPPAFVPDQAIGLYLVIRPALFMTVTSLVAAFLGLVSGAMLGITVPYMRARERGKRIDLVFPDCLGMMYSLTEGGMNQIGIFEEIADSQDVYGELSVEFERIVRQTEMFGRDYDSAIQEVAETTPSDELSRFLADMAAVLNQGGAFRDFVENQHEVVLEARESEQETRLRALETFGQIYITVLILPMLILIVLVIMAMTGSPRPRLLFLTVYIVEPALNLGFLVFVLTIKLDEPGDGLMQYRGLTLLGDHAQTSFDTPVADAFSGYGGVFETIQDREQRYRASHIVQHPFKAARRNPEWLFAMTAPIAVASVGLLLWAGVVQPSLDAFLRQSFVQTTGVFVVPFFLMVTPYMAFYELGKREHGKVTDTIHEDMRKLANTNDTGRPLHEAILITAEQKESAFADELARVYKKLQFGVPLQQGLVEMNNKFAEPKLSRKIKVIEKASEVSSNIPDVLQTAAELAAVEKDLERERQVRTAMQVVVLEVSFLVFLAIIAAMDSTLVDMVASIIGSDPAWPNFEDVDPDLIGMLFYHAVLIQGSLSGLIAGYVQTGVIRDGVKIMYANVALTVAVWVALELFV